VGGSITSGFRATNGAGLGSSSALAGFSCQIPLVSSNVFQFFTRAGRGFIGQDAVVDHLTFFPTTGRVGIGTGITDSGALLQVGTNTTTSAGGMVFGTDCNIYRLGTNTAALGAGGNATLFWDANNFGSGAQTAGVAVISRSGISAASPGYSFYNDANTGMFSDANDTMKFATASNLALTIDSSQRMILSGALRLNNAYVAGAVVGTGYVTIQDSTGTTYRVPVLV
jgi:hypothetical protein